MNGDAGQNDIWMTTTQLTDLCEFQIGDLNRFPIHLKTIETLISIFIYHPTIDLLMDFRDEPVSTETHYALRRGQTKAGKMTINYFVVIRAFSFVFA